MFRNNKTAAIFLLQKNPVGVELFSYVNTYFCSNKFAKMLPCEWKRSIGSYTENNGVITRVLIRGLLICKVCEWEALLGLEKRELFSGFRYMKG